MAFQALRSNTNLVIRLAKNALVNDTEDDEKENPGPLSGTSSDFGVGVPGDGYGYYGSFGSATVTHIINLTVEDEVSVYITNIATIDVENVDAVCRYGYSQLLVEYLGA